MSWMNKVAEYTGYSLLWIVALGICGSVAGYVNELLRREKEDQYPEYGWSREMPRYSSMWDQLQAAAATEDAPASDTPGEGV